MNYTLLVIMTIVLSSTLMGMDTVDKIEKPNGYTFLKSISITKEINPFLVDAFFLKDKVVLASRNGYCNSFRLDDYNKEQTTVFFWPQPSDIPGATLKNIMYDPQSESVCALSNMYTCPSFIFGKGAAKFKDEKDAPTIAFGQALGIKKLDSNSFERWNNFAYQTITFVDPQFKFVSTYSSLGFTYSIWKLLNKNDLLRLYPTKNSSCLIKSIAFHTPKSICTIALVKKIITKTKQYVNDNYVGTTESFEEKKKLKLISTKDWITLWKRSGEAQNISFNTAGTAFAYTIKNKLYRCNTQNGTVDGISKLPQLLQEVTSIIYSEDDSEIVVADGYNNQQAVFNTQTGECERIESYEYQPEKQIRFSEDRSLKLEVKPFKIDIYKKTN